MAQFKNITSQPLPSRRVQIGVLIRVIAALVGVVVVLAGYYVTHKPLELGIAPPYNIEVATRIGGALLDLLTVGALFMLSGGVGRAFILWTDRRLPLGMEQISRPERMAFYGTSGFALVSFGALLLGMVGLYRPLILWAALFTAGLLVRASVRDWLLDWRALLGSVRFTSPAVVVMILYSGVMLSLSMLYGLAAPQHWDGLTYQLVGPQRYLEAGMIVPQPDNFYLGFPQQVNLLFGITMGLFGRDTAAAPVHFLYGIFGLLAVVGVTARYTNHAYGWLALVLLLSAFNLWALFGWPYNDLAVMTYGALALVSALAWRETGLNSKRGAPGWLLVLGMVVGLAVGVKYTAGALGLAVGIFVLIHQPRAVLRNGFIAGLAAAAAFSPWAVRGLLHYGNPIYPFVFYGLNWDAQRAEFFSFSERGLLATGNALQAVFLPVSATIFGIDKTDGFGFTAGPWLLTAFLLLPLVWMSLDGKGRRLAASTVVFLAPMLVFWAITALSSSVGMQTRLMTMTLPAFAVAGAAAFYGLAHFPRKPLDLNFMIRALFVLTIAIGFIDTARIITRERVVPYLLAVSDMNDYLYTNTGAHYGAMQALRDLPAGSQVRFMWEPRTFYCPDTVTCVPDILFDNWLRPLLQDESPDEAFAAYRAAGDDYLLLWHAGFDEYRDVFSRYETLNAQFMPALERHMTPVWTDTVRYTLYTWR